MQFLNDVVIGCGGCSGPTGMQAALCRITCPSTSAANSRCRAPIDSAEGVQPRTTVATRGETERDVLMTSFGGQYGKAGPAKGDPWVPRDGRSEEGSTCSRDALVRTRVGHPPNLRCQRSRSGVKGGVPVSFTFLPPQFHIQGEAHMGRTHISGQVP